MNDQTSEGFYTVTSCDGAIQLASQCNAHLYLGLLPRNVRAEVDCHLYEFVWHNRGVLVPTFIPPKPRNCIDTPHLAIKRDGHYVIVASIVSEGKSVRLHAQHRVTHGRSLT